MSYADAKTKIVTILAAIAGIKRVYTNPPNTLQDWPSFIIYPAGQIPERRPSGWRVDRYTVLCRLVAHDSDWDSAAATMETIRPLVIDAFDGSVQLGGKADVITGPEVDPAIQFSYGDRAFLGMDFRLNVRIGNDRLGGFVS